MTARMLPVVSRPERPSLIPGGDEVVLRARYAAGESIASLAREYGVSREVMGLHVSPPRWVRSTAYQIRRIERRVCGRCYRPDCTGCFAVAGLGEVET